MLNKTNYIMSSGASVLFFKKYMKSREKLILDQFNNSFWYEKESNNNNLINETFNNKRSKFKKEIKIKR